MFSAELSSRGERLHKTNSAAERTLLGAVGGYTGTLQVAVLPPLLCRSMIKTRRQRRRALPKMRKQQMPVLSLPGYHVKPAHALASAHRVVDRVLAFGTAVQEKALEMFQAQHQGLNLS